MRQTLCIPVPLDDPEKFMAQLVIPRELTQQECDKLCAVLNSLVSPFPKIWYARDNHTALALPLEVEAALALVREDISDGNTYGMLYSKHPQLRESVHARSLDEWSDFEPKAREWLARAVALVTPNVQGEG
jgi:hypothetical protein